MNKYKNLSIKARKERSKQKMCLRKKSYNTLEEAKKNNQKIYQCPHCNKFHCTAQFSKFVRKLSLKSVALLVFSNFIIMSSVFGQYSYAKKVVTWKPKRIITGVAYGNLKMRLDKTLFTLREDHGKLKFTFKPILNGSGIYEVMNDGNFYGFKNVSIMRTDMRMKVYLDKEYALVTKVVANTAITRNIYALGFVARFPG